MLAILDYGAGNQTSVKRGLEHLGIPAKITRQIEDLQSAEGIIFPGVGAAAQAMAALAASGLDVALKDMAKKMRPILGICLGCQILLDFSEEENTQTLGILPGICKRFNPDWEDGNSLIRIPHMGWNGVKKTRSHPLWKNIPEDAEFYFVHGYFVQPEKKLILGATTYGHEFCSVYGNENIWAAQFHPEKSGAPGLRFLENFYTRCLHAKEKA